MNNVNIAVTTVNDLLQQAKHVLATHIRPDADAACSVAALAEIILGTNPSAAVAVLNYDEVYHTSARCGICMSHDAMPYVGASAGEEADETGAVLWVLDCATWDRVAGAESLEGGYSQVVVIDHHPTTEQDIEADVLIKDPKAAATGELILDMLAGVVGGFSADSPVPSLRWAALAAARAVMGDTGNLTLPNVTSKTLYCMSWARAHVQDPDWDGLQSNFREKSLDALQTQARAMLQTRQLEDVAFIASSDNVLPEARAGLANQLLDIKGVRFAFTVLPDSAGQPFWRCAVRCTPEVSGAAKYVAGCFGGGGHACASGCSFSQDEYPTPDAAAGAILRNYWQSLDNLV